MSEVKTMDFIDEVYREMKENDFVMSLPVMLKLNIKVCIMMKYQKIT